MRKILIVTASDELLTMLAEDYEITLCRNAQDAIKLLHQEFNGLILDLFLPGTDGLTLLEQAQAHLPPVVLVLTRLLSPYILQSVASLCGGYVLRIPCSEREIRHRLEDMFRKFESPDHSTDATAVQYHLRHLGLSPARRGFHCAAFILPHYHPDADPCLFKDFYPALAKKYAVTPAAIDNALHREILRAYQNRNDAVWQEYFSDTSHCPGNKAFLSAVAARMK